MSKSLKLSEIATRLGVHLAPNFADVLITGTTSISGAVEGSIVFAETQDSYSSACASKASAIVGCLDFESSKKPLLPVEDPKRVFVQIINLFHPVRRGSGKIHSTAILEEETKIGTGVTIDPFCTVGRRSTIGQGSWIGAGCHIGNDVQIGSHTVLRPGVVVEDDSIIGDHVEILANSVIGCRGFGYVPTEGRLLQFPQIGKVVIEDHVDIGSCTTIGRATFDETRIAKGSKVGNLVEIGHNTHIGENCIICACSGIAGSCVLEEGAILGGQAGLGEQAKIGARAVVGAQAGVPPKEEVGAGQTLMDYHPTSQKESLDLQIGLKRLPKLRAKLLELEKLVLKKLGS